MLNVSGNNAEPHADKQIMKIKQIIFGTLLLFLNSFAFGQTSEKVVVSNQDPYNLYNFEPTDTTTLFYIKFVPKIKPIGCLVILPSSGELVENVIRQISLHKHAVQEGFLVVFPSINWGTNKFNKEHNFQASIRTI